MSRAALGQNWQGSLKGSFDLGVGASSMRDAARRRRWTIRAPLCLAIIAGSTIVLPVIYSVVLFDQWNAVQLPREYARSLVLNLACNLLFVLVAFLARGRIERKLGRMLVSALIVHAILGVALVTAGLPYTRPMLAMGTSISIACGVGTVCFLHRVRSRRVAAIGCGLSPEIERWLGPGIDIVRECSEDLRHYEVILVNFDEALADRWAKSTSRAVLAGAEVAHIAEYLERARRRVSPEHFELDQPNVALIDGPYAIIKRLIDIALAVVAAPAVLLILGAAGLAVALTSGRPICFVQNRVGRGNKIFRMYKLRTMRGRSPDEAVGATASHDDRIMPIGHFLRRYRIDELPQMWNVVKGEMSLIGPRPEQPELAREYARQMPAFSYRHLVRPGITGWAQVRFGYAENYQETREKLTYDLHYIKDFGFIIDLQVAILTVGVVLGGTSGR